MTNYNPGTTLIIDGNNLAHRVKHTFSLSHNGKDVSITYGFIRVLLKYIRDFQPQHVIVCWDGGVPEFRREAVPEYKAMRHVNDDPFEYQEFERQVRELDFQALPLMGVLSVRKRGAEADDLMHHASRILEGDSIIVSNDKDMYQSANEYVRIFSPSKEELYSVEDIEEMTGVLHTNYIHWRAIQGDGSDGIPGVPGIGPKTATKLFQRYKYLTNITNAALGRHPDDNLTGKTADSINSFGFDRICKNVFVMALYADRVGAKCAIVDAIGNYKMMNKKELKKYFMLNAFVSFMEPEIYKMLFRLTAPHYMTKGIRFPIICMKRYPV